MPRTLLEKASIGVASLVGLYAIILGALLTPDVQRFALYAHKFNTLFLHDVDQAERFGFAKRQVTPFHIKTSDGETLYAWHILPTNVYAQHEHAFSEEERPDGIVSDFTKTLAFRLLTSGESKVVVSFHGNAGHIAQGWRPDTFRYVTTQPNTHVVTIDYRGFGKSTGSPTEAGLIEDGTTLVNWVLQTGRIPPERVVVLGQSLGTAVASAVALRFADPSSDLIPGEKSLLTSTAQTSNPTHSTVFSAIILVAPFSSLPSLLLTYRIGGFLPILLPLRPLPTLARYLTSQMVDKWPTAARLAAYYSILSQSPLATPGAGRLELFHAINDMDISYHQSEMICQRVLGSDEKCIEWDERPVVDVRTEGKPRARFELLEFGGHNRIITYSPIAAAVVRAYEGI